MLFIYYKREIIPAIYLLDGTLSETNTGINTNYS